MLLAVNTLGLRKRGISNGDQSKRRRKPEQVKFGFDFE